MFDFTILQSDFTRNNMVDFEDFLILVSDFGRADELVTLPKGDVDHSKALDFQDFLVLSDEFNTDLSDDLDCNVKERKQGRGRPNRPIGQQRKELQQRDLALFEDLRDGGASIFVLAMGLSLLNKTYSQTHASPRKWDDLRDRFFAETDGLEEAFVEITAMLDQR